MTEPDELVRRARRYAEQAHHAIDHRRKYSRRPYIEHLERVAARVAQATGDAEAAEDIGANDPHFARVYLREMAARLEILSGGDPRPLEEARLLHARVSGRGRWRGHDHA